MPISLRRGPAASGEDDLDGGAGNDSLNGGPDDDRIVGGPPARRHRLDHRGAVLRATLVAVVRDADGRRQARVVRRVSIR